MRSSTRSIIPTQNHHNRGLMSLFLLFLFLLLPTCTNAQAKLKQVHVIARHGARTPLGKDPDTLLEQGGSTLTPLGQQQLYELGVWLRDTYNTAHASGFATSKTWLDLYDPSEVRLESSNLDRTLTSANSLSMGLFPLNAQAGNHGVAIFQSFLPKMPSLPVYTRQESNDIYLRAYLNCPTFEQNLNDLYTSSQWRIVEQNNQGILKELGELFPDKANDQNILPLKHLWSAYDQIHVARTECQVDTMAFACISLDSPDLKDALSDSEFDQAESLMEQSEEMKFGVATAKNMLGSNLLWQILSRATQEGKFFLYSAHAPTVLGFLSTLQEWAVDERFVDYGSAVICEIYQDETSREFTLRFLYKAAKNNVARYLPLKHVDCTEARTIGGEETVDQCILTKFVTWATKNTLWTEDDWCEACGNVDADVCMQSKLEENRLENSLEQTIEDTGYGPSVIAVTFFSGWIGGMLLMGLFSFLCCRNGKKTEQQTSDLQLSQEQAPSNNAVGTDPEDDDKSAAYLS